MAMRTSPATPDSARSGYSGTPLVRKLGIAAGHRVFAAAAPDGFVRWLEPLPEDVQFVRRADRNVDVAIVFAQRRADLRKRLSALRSALRPDAALWTCWPKQSAKTTSDISENAIREDALPLGFVDVKVCAIDDTWSGLKFVLRKELR